MADPAESVPRRLLSSRQVEPAAVKWVIEYERSQGRHPVDRRYVRAFPGDIESPPRIIEVRAALLRDELADARLRHDPRRNDADHSSGAHTAGAKAATRSEGTAAVAGAGRGTLADAIHRALEDIGGGGMGIELRHRIESWYPGRWKATSISTTLADLTYPGNVSSQYPPERRFLERVAPGRYRLRR